MHKQARAGQGIAAACKRGDMTRAWCWGRALPMMAQGELASCLYRNGPESCTMGVPSVLRHMGPAVLLLRVLGHMHS